MIDEIALHAFLARIIGWSPKHAPAVENAIRAVRLSVTCRVALVLLGDFDLAPIAYAIHRRTLGAERPFVLCNPHRLAEHQTTRALPSRPSGVGALEAAQGGTLCIRAAFRPRDFSSALALARDPRNAAQIIVCAETRHADSPFLIVPPPIHIPPLKERPAELPRIVAEYAADAIRDLGADDGCLSEGDRRWILEHASESLAAIEMATMRLVAWRALGTSDAAGKLLGMPGVTLRQWYRRRRLRRLRRVRRVRRGGNGVRSGAHLMLVGAT
jgi:hypothetical protein